MAAKFQAIRSVSLEGVGDGWTKDCYIRFRTYSLDDYKVIREMVDELEAHINKNPNKPVPISHIEKSIELHTELFVDGKGFDADSNEIVDLSRDDVEAIMSIAGVRDLIQEVLVDTTRLKGLKQSTTSLSSNKAKDASTATPTSTQNSPTS